MKKIYSLLLTAAALLVGTNAWASLHNSEEEGDVAKVQINGGAWQYTDDLKEAFDAVDPGATAKIVLLDDVTIDKAINMPKELPAANSSSKLKDILDQTITLDLGGFTLTGETANEAVLRLFKGSLDIKNGTITKNAKGSYCGRYVINVFGTSDPDAADWSVLTIEKDVIMNVPTDGIGIVIQDHDVIKQLPNTDPFSCTKANLLARYGYCTHYLESAKVAPGTTLTEEQLMDSCGTAKWPMACGAITTTANQFQQGSAFGVKVYIDGIITGNNNERALQVIGHVNQKPKCIEGKEKRFKPTAPYYDKQYPYVNIGSTAILTASKDPGNVCIYGAGYAVFDIAGEVKGATGLYLKAGDVQLNDAIISSNCTTFSDDKGKSSGVGEAGGSAIVIESNSSYAGEMGVTISGDTKVTGNGGYGILEITSRDTSTTSNITIEGGTIESGTKGGIAITNDAKDVTNITGVTIDDETVEVTNGGITTTVSVSTLVPNNDDYHSTTTVVDGKTVTVITQGAAPIEAPGTDLTDWDYIKGYSDTASTLPNMKWEAIEQATIANGVTVKLGELQIISGSTGNLQQLTIKDGGVLEANQLLLNDYARIIVEAGGKLIVKGSQGIVAGVVENIKLENEENKPAVFIFNPAVTSNRHPNATVEFLSKGYNKGGSNYAWQKFGVPTQTDELTEISIEGDVATAFGKFNYAAATPAWEVIGYLNTTPEVDLNDLNQSFEYYQMLHNTTTVGTKVTFKGKLVGNDCPAPAIRANFWNGYANSYSAPIDAEALLAQIPAPADKAFYLYEQDVLTEKFSWVAKSMLLNTPVQPMQPFLIRNPKADATALALNYEAAVYNPATTPSNAPARHATDNMTKVEFVVRGENGVDHVVVAQDAQFSAEFDNGYDVAKYMNDDVNMYVSANEKMAIFATDNLENTYVGFQSVKGGNYTITFANVQGEDLTLIDHETGARVLMVEGNTYEFTANGANDYRFEIVKTHEVATAIENAEAVKSAKGIYTITGQYVGEMNVWNSLPAGVYVIDGAKRVK